ncbi:MAG: YbaY family lipoprotein [Alphaproteobacteria bacterium]|nr:YbaY family lipoprotein [Alphaproteobacteria bacterium]MBV8411827.1 YbaY family lipoprotein [Alphaproteobacteria bacterium]
MRIVVLLLLGGVIAQAADAQQRVNLTTAALTRCAGKIGTDTRQADPAFATFGLDGPPWLTAEHTEDKIGSLNISTTISGTGWRRRRDGTSVPFRFVCTLDAKGQAVAFHAAPLQRHLGDQLPPAIVVEGAAAYLDKKPLPKGVELQVQLLDVSKSPKPEVLTEEVVRSGWQLPIPFALRLPKDVSLEGRKLEITARFVQARQPLFQLSESRPLAPDDLHKFIILTLDKVEQPVNATNAPANSR